MLALAHWVPHSNKQNYKTTHPSSALIDGLVSRLLSLQSSEYVAQLLDEIIAQDEVFFQYTRELNELIEAARSDVGPSQNMIQLLNELEPLVSAIDTALGQANNAALLGRVSRFENTLRMRASITYDEKSPPPAVTRLVAANQMVPLALLLLAYFEVHEVGVSQELTAELALIAKDGCKARLIHLASLGYDVPESLIPFDQRLDIDALYAEQEEFYGELAQDAAAFAKERLASRAAS